MRVTGRPTAWPSRSAADVVWSVACPFMKSVRARVRTRLQRSSEVMGRSPYPCFPTRRRQMEPDRTSDRLRAVAFAKVQAAGADADGTYGFTIFFVSTAR